MKTIEAQRRCVLGLLALFALGALPGCAERRFTRERFDMIQANVDSRTDVREILGKPKFSAGDEWYYEDLKRHYAARVFYDADGRVRGKEWMDARSGEWEGRHPGTNEPLPGPAREIQTSKTRIDD